MHNLLKQFFRFSLVGVTAFIIDFALLVALTEFCGINPLISAAVSFTVSLIYNYLASMRFVYSHRDDLSRKREFGLFIMLSVVGLALNELIMWIGELLFVHHGANYVEDNHYMFVKLCAAIIVSLWNFLSRRHWLDGQRVQEVSS